MSAASEFPLFCPEAGEEYLGEDAQRAMRASYERVALTYLERHLTQSAEESRKLRARYAEPLIGECRVEGLLGLLAQCVDPSDTQLYMTSQLTHALQVVSAMRAEGV